MRWKYNDPGEWRPWFAWFPVYLENGQMAWLETVLRKIHVWGWGFEDRFYRPRKPVDDDVDGEAK